MSEQQLPKIEGISPDMIWTFLVVLVGLMALVVLGDKVMDVFRNALKRRKERREVNGQDITDRIADKVLEKLTPAINDKFDALGDEIESIKDKLEKDKERLDSHEAQLNTQRDRVDRLDNDTRALLHGMSALLSHEVNGSNTEKLKRTQTAMSNYLIDRKYKEEAWQ